MQRYFLHSEDIVADDSITIKSSDIYHHMKNVMRMNVDNKVYCVDKSKNTYVCSIFLINDNQIVLRIDNVQTVSNDLPVNVTIVQALPKKDKLEWIVQKGTELGANEFLIYDGDRSIPKWDHKKKRKKLERLNKIAEEASEQSHRTSMPTIAFESLSNIVSEANYDLTIFAYEEEAKQKDHQSIANLLQNENYQSICVVIGPEGGFSSKEVKFLQEHNYQSVRLGRRILRTETAAMYVLSVLSYLYEELEI